MRKRKNYLTDILTKFRFQIDGLGGEDFKYHKLHTIRVIVKKPKGRKRHPLLKASLDLKSLARVRQTPFRLQLTLDRHYLVTQYRKHGIKNPIDEFVEVKQVNKVKKTRKEIIYLVDMEIIDNMLAVKMMSDLHKTIKRQKKKKKPTKKIRRKRRRSRQR